MSENTNAWIRYQDAETELHARAEALEAELPTTDYSEYAWIYTRDSTGAFVASDPAAPAWSIEAWRSSQVDGELSAESLALVEASLKPDATGFYASSEVWVTKSPELAAELRRLEDERDARLGVIGDLEEQLEAQRLREWSAYGEALRERVEAAARALPGLQVPVRVVVDVDIYHNARDRTVEDWTALGTRLIEAAVMVTPIPADLPCQPLGRPTGTTLGMRDAAGGAGGIT